MERDFDGPDDFLRWNEEMAHKYDPESYHLRSSPVIRWIERRRVQAILHLLEAGSEDTVVEVGCGAGIVLSQIQAGTLVGVDLSSFLLNKAARRLHVHQATLVLADAEQLPLPSDRYRKIVCTEVIEHVLHPRRLAKELARIAAPDATIVITIPNEALIERSKGLIQRLGLARWFLQGASEPDAYHSPGEANEWHLHHFELSLLKEVTAGSLVIQQLRAVPFRFLPLRYVLSFRPVLARK
jgi:2-polyprenyl-3-methyl-5-hydroxy-6-metoxy-1,4-benzoquinol methylase